MNITILPAKKTTEDALDYSERKVAQGKASVQFCANMPGDDMYTIYSTFKRYEDNPNVSSRTRNYVLHFAVSPGPEDVLCFRDDVVAFIGDLMKRLGYADVPYVVYRHNDIPREHFHVVAPSNDAEGRNIDKRERASNGGKRRLTVMLGAVRELGPRYGFTLGKGDAGEWLDEEEAKEVKRGYTIHLEPVAEAARTGAVADIRKACRNALDYDFNTFAQFQMLLLLRNIKVSRSRRKGNLFFQKLSAVGGPSSRPVVDGEVFPDGSLEAELSARVDVKRGRGGHGAERLGVIVRACCEKASRVPDFLQALRDCGLLVMSGKAGEVYVADPKGKVIRNCSAFVNMGRTLSPGQRASRVPFLDADAVRSIVGGTESKKINVKF